ncbi:hypothetical protein C0995_014230 [Termitomyces sp. Mi166|nr:hypothetical protein C0995_014230 [Termitomyces sp. Mi166\
MASTTLLCLLLSSPVFGIDSGSSHNFLRRASSSSSRKVPQQGFYNPFDNGGSFLTKIPVTFPMGQGEPVNTIISGNSDEAVLVDSESDGGLRNYFESLGFSGECLGQKEATHQAVNLGDGHGYLNETAVIRWNYGDPSLGTCKETIQGGDHFRYWIQNGPAANSGAIFMAVSYELPLAKQHDIIPNGYDLGRGSTSANGFTYHSDILYVSGLLSNTSDGINHNVTVAVNGSNAVDGLVAILTVKITEKPQTTSFIIVDDSTIHDSSDDADIPRSHKRQRTQDEPPSLTIPGTSKRKATPEPRTWLRSDYDGTIILIHDPKYYFADDPAADCFIRVEKILFKLMERRITGRTEPITGQNPLELFGVSVTEFRALMWAREDDAEGQPRALEDLERLLSLATVTKNFGFDRLHDWTIDSMHRVFSSDSSLVDSCSSAILTRVIEVATQYKATDLLEATVSKWCTRVRRKDSPAVPAILAADEYELAKLAGVAYYTHLLEAIEQASPPTADSPLRIPADPKLSSKQIIRLLSGHMSLVNFSERYKRRAPKLECVESCSADAHKACTLVWDERWQAAAGSRKVLALCSADVLGLVAEMSDQLSGDDLGGGITEACRLVALQSLKQSLRDIREKLPQYFVGCLTLP